MNVHGKVVDSQMKGRLLLVRAGAEALKKCGDFSAPSSNACGQGLSVIRVCCHLLFNQISAVIQVLLRRGVIPCIDICLNGKTFSLSRLQTLFGVVLPRENRSQV